MHYIFILVYTFLPYRAVLTLKMARRKGLSSEEIGKLLQNIEEYNSECEYSDFEDSSEEHDSTYHQRSSSSSDQSSSDDEHQSDHCKNG